MVDNTKAGIPYHATFKMFDLRYEQFSRPKVYSTTCLDGLLDSDYSRETTSSLTNGFRCFVDSVLSSHINSTSFRSHSALYADGQHSLG